MEPFPNWSVYIQIEHKVPNHVTWVPDPAKAFHKNWADFYCIPPFSVIATRPQKILQFYKATILQMGVILVLSRDLQQCYTFW